MKQIFIIIALVIVLSSVSTQIAVAQKLRGAPIVHQKNYLSTPAYNKMAREALRNRPSNFSFMRFRSLYSRTRQYDPIGETALKAVNDLAYIVLHEEDTERADTALFAYQVEVSNHLAHIDVVMLALSLAREDKRFGKPSFFEWVRDGLVKTVVISGDGNSLNGAYDVITLSEEIILFNRLGFKRSDTMSRKAGVIYYNMHDGEDLHTGKKRTVFVNTSIPMKHLEALKKEQQDTFTLDIRKQ